jgi:cell fate regulator YaaT (PSP1 superfamily)
MLPKFEHEAYMDALKEFPDLELVLKTQKGEAICQKIDVFKKLMWYATSKTLKLPGFTPR